MVNNDHLDKYSWSHHWAHWRRGPMIYVFLGSSRDFWMAMVKDDLSARAKFIIGLIQWCKSSPYMGCSFLVSQCVTGWKVLVSSQSLLLVHKFSYKFRFLDDDGEKLFAFVRVSAKFSIGLIRLCNSNPVMGMDILWWIKFSHMDAHLRKGHLSRSSIIS